MTIFSVPGKIILSGEHAVVYGYPALAAAVNKKITLKLFTKNNFFKFKISSNIPSRCGMGSSAALSIVRAAAFLQINGYKLDKKIINKIAFNLEKLNHGQPSGLDNTVSLYGGIIFYKNQTFKKLSMGLPSLVLINSGKPQETTKEMVKLVAQKPPEILAKISSLPEKFIKVLAEKNYQEFKNLITRNEILLEELGIAGKKAKSIIRKIQDLGGSAKISGAGGVKTGSGMILAYHQKPQILQDFCLREKLEFFPLKLAKKGLSCEEK